MNKTNNLLIVVTLLMSLQFVSCKSQLKKEVVSPLKSKQPNIVLLFVDDWGWADIGYRNPLFETPNINQLKTESLDFNRAYIPTPTCSPSRASLLTGKEAVRMEMVRHISGNPDEEKYSLWPGDPVQMPSINYLPVEEVTYAERLKEYGYYNMFIGKWHLGHEANYPDKQGFDEMYGTTNAGHPKNYYFPFFNADEDPKEFLKSGLKEGDYLTDVLTNGATDFIKNYDKNEPFMLSFWYYTVHGPQVGRKDLIAKYKAKGMEGKYADLGAMVETLDESVGKVRKALEEKGIADNTIIILISDQGGAFPNTPLSGGKKGGNTLGEGGARVPFMVYYPGVTKANTVTDIPVQSLDLYPTLIEIASGKKCTDDWIQGKSLMPILKGDTMEKRKLYFFRSYEDQYAAVIDGDWKLIKYHSGKFQLFNVKEDISEQNDLIDKNLEKGKELKKAIAEWEKEAVPVY
ncbi:sulfatase [Mariniflexile sp. AS56]|uniref:sulfatase n=1 Tax=Mariniflexile sp. AS56 TaxID=3063957 RepID=UPI0026E92A20|nr:sulfatase [Mariniflexile sp. AS56]MDO7173161.1 sulfatase [Mariniflexile sp. AS56]